jgi:hypothetical protein
MNSYMYLFRGASRMKNFTPEEKERHLQKWGEWMGELEKKGQLDGGLPLAMDGKRVSNGGAVVTDGPFAEGKEVVGGYVIVKADSLDEATQISRTCPILDDGGEIEIREILHATE